MATEFTTSHNASGAVATGADFDFDMAITYNRVDLCKVKVIPSGSTIGYAFSIYKTAARLLADRQYATKDPKQGNTYDPTDRSGAEVLQGFIMPYEDLDGGLQIHCRLHNYDSVSRSFDTYLDWKETGLNPSSVVTGEVLSAVSVTQNLASTPVVGSERIFRNGLRLRSGAGLGYTIAGAVITLSVPYVAGEDLLADYLKA